MRISKLIEIMENNLSQCGGEWISWNVGADAWGGYQMRISKLKAYKTAKEYSKIRPDAAIRVMYKKGSLPAITYTNYASYSYWRNGWTTKRCYVNGIRSPLLEAIWT